MSSSLPDSATASACPLPPVKPSLDEFRQLASRGRLIPVYAQLAADFDTPLSIYAKIRSAQNSPYAFLLESAESSSSSGRWSIIGSSPRKTFSARGNSITIASDNGDLLQFQAKSDVLAELRELMAPYSPVPHGDPPPFYGGAVGFLAYDSISQFEPSVSLPANNDLDLPDATFLLTRTVIVYDHKLRRILVIANAIPDESGSVEESYAEACQDIAHVIQTLDQPFHKAPLNGLTPYVAPEFQSNTTREEYEAMVLRVQDLIRAGDIFQCVPSQRFQTPYSGSPVDLYRALRHINPSPYMFILEMDDFSLVGSSPEVHVRSIGGRIDIRPIAGTRPRGETPQQDDALAADLLADAKECAEHLMLVDLARNDVGRISLPGSVTVDDFMIIERYSHVMHIVSNVHGSLSPDFDAYDVLRATFPAGTVSGAPKIRAMQILGEMENSRRGTYAGAIGYFGWDGNMDTCIALRTCLLKNGMAYVQAGAGVVADSVPASEYQETVNKARGMMRAIGLAKTISP